MMTIESIVEIDKLALPKFIEVRDKIIEDINKLKEDNSLSIQKKEEKNKELQKDIEFISRWIEDARWIIENYELK